MTVKIRVQNFQSIEDSEIEVSGLTVITGTNNGGKSALHRAVFAAFTNAKGTSFVRIGTPQCTVSITFEDGQSLVWEKGEKVNRYTVNGKVLNKVGAGAPPPEVQAFHVVPIEAAGRELWPQFAHQFTGQVFLLDQPGSVLAESIADVTRVGVLNEALRETQSERRSQASELKVRVADVAKLEAHESTYAGLDRVELLTREAEDLDREVDSLRGQLSEIQGFQKGIEALTDAVGDLIPARWVEMPPSGRPLLEDLKAITEAQDLYHKLTQAQAIHDSFAPAASITIPEESMFLRAEKVAEALVIIRSLRDQMTPLVDVVRQGEKIREALTVPISGAEVPQGQMKALDECVQLQRELASSVKLLKDLGDEAESLESLYQQAVHEVQDILGGVGDCPICGRS